MKLSHFTNTLVEDQLIDVSEKEGFLVNLQFINSLIQREGKWYADECFRLRKLK